MGLRRLRRLGVLAAVPLLCTGCGERYFILNPAGPVANVEKNLIVLTFVLTGIVVIPVIALMAFIVTRYRDKPGNTAPYEPEWSESKTLEIIWWGIPILIIAILGTFTVRDTFRLVRPPVASGPPMTIQVTSLDWKWLFQYPGQNIATVNYVRIPAGRPVEFVLTSHAPMNSFWVPQLGGQEYTMPGMAMRLWLQADRPGTYFGSGANFTGRGFAHMRFNVIAMPSADFDRWTQQVKRTAPPLTTAGYKALEQQSVVGQLQYSSFPKGLFEQTIRTDGGMYMKQKMETATD
ncbi:MAG: ubiquinol oxidase subunit II [Alicyclobacillus sp.]|nr:ubiquinol oxidase subunit II [Alicyclobacillus sp.]